MKSLKFVVLFCLTCLITISIIAQEEKSKPRVFITDSQSWEMSGGLSGTNDTAAGTVSGGALLLVDGAGAGLVAGRSATGDSFRSRQFQGAIGFD